MIIEQAGALTIIATWVLGGRATVLGRALNIAVVGSALISTASEVRALTVVLGALLRWRVLKTARLSEGLRLEHAARH